MKPNTGDNRPRSPSGAYTRWQERTGVDSADRRECELCQTVKRTNEKYGLVVCPSCDESLLP